MKKQIFITDTDFANTDSSFEYLLWFQPSLWGMVLSNNELVVLLDGRYFSKTKDIDTGDIIAKIWSTDFTVRFVEVHDITQSIIWELEQRDVLCFQNNIALKYYDDIRNKFPQNEISFSDSYFGKKRQIKTQVEKNNIIEAIKIIDNVFLYIQSIINSWDIFWKTELQVRQLVIQKIFDLGGEWESFETIIAFGKNSAVPHHVSWNTRIENGVLLIDMWAKYNWYCSDFTRTVWVGEKTSNLKNSGKCIL